MTWSPSLKPNWLSTGLQIQPDSFYCFLDGAVDITFQGIDFDLRSNVMIYKLMTLFSIQARIKPAGRNHVNLQPALFCSQPAICKMVKLQRDCMLLNVSVSLSFTSYHVKTKNNKSTIGSLRMRFSSVLSNIRQFSSMKYLASHTHLYTNIINNLLHGWFVCAIFIIHSLWKIAKLARLLRSLVGLTILYNWWIKIRYALTNHEVISIYPIA